MASSSVEPKSLLCFCWNETNTGKSFFMNFWSDPQKDKPIKLPQYMIEAAGIPESATNPIKEMSEMQVIREEVEAIIRSSLKAWYGNKLPRVYLTEDGQDFVMNLYIYKKHSEEFKKLARNRRGTVFLMFTRMTLAVIRDNIKKVINEPNLLIDSQKFQLDHWEMSRCEPTGKRAKKDEISPFLLDASAQEQPGSSVGSNQHLLCIGLEDKSKRRSIYFNIIASDRPESIRLPKLMIRVSQEESLEALFSAELVRHPQIGLHACDELVGYLNRLYHHEKPVVFVSKNNDKDLVINVPLHVEHVPVLERSLIGKMKLFFFGSLASFHRQYFLDVSGRTDLESTVNLLPIDHETKFVEPGRLATKEEIYSLLLTKKRCAYSIYTHA